MTLKNSKYMIFIALPQYLHITIFAAQLAGKKPPKRNVDLACDWLWINCRNEKAAQPNTNIINLFSPSRIAKFSQLDPIPFIEQLLNDWD